MSFTASVTDKDKDVKKYSREPETLNETELRYTDVSEMAEDIAADVIENATAIVNKEDTKKAALQNAAFKSYISP